MIVTWMGPSPRTSHEFQNQRPWFDHGVPSWMPDLTANALYENSGFVIGASDSPQPGRPIFVALSWHLDLFLSSLLTLAKIQRVFPTCPIEITCNPDHAALLGSVGLRYVQSRAATPYYREYVLTHEAHPDLLDVLRRRTAPLQQLILMASGLLEPADAAHIGFELPTEPGQAGVLVLNHAWGSGIIEPALYPAVIRAIEPAPYDELEVPPPPFQGLKLGEVLATMMNADTVISIGDSPITLLALALGKWVYMLKPRPMIADNSRLYGCYAKAQIVSGAGVTTIDELAQRLVDSAMSEHAAPHTPERWATISVHTRGPGTAPELVTDKPVNTWNSTTPRVHEQPVGRGARRGRADHIVAVDDMIQTDSVVDKTPTPDSDDDGA